MDVQIVMIIFFERIEGKWTSQPKLCDIADMHGPESSLKFYERGEGGRRIYIVVD
jgi:hypothetical protein